MTKKEFQKVEEDAAPAAPQLTFTEEEHKALVDFVNMADKYIKLEAASFKEAHDIAAKHLAAIKVIKKVENHILELKRVWKPEKKAD